VQGHGQLGVTTRARPARGLPVWQRYCISTPVRRSELPSSRRGASAKAADVIEGRAPARGGDVQRRTSIGRRFEPGETLPLHGGIETHDTHGHTVGHVSLLLPAERILIAGDALNNRAGMGGSSPEYTADPADARAAAQLEALRPDTLVFGHGPSIVGGAAAQLEALDASLGG